MWTGRFLFVLLALGFSYSAIGSARECVRVLSAPAVSGSNASIDDLAAPLEVGSTALRAAVLRAGWAPDRDVVMLTAVSSMPPDAIRRAHFVVSYLLFPRRVWLAPWCDALAAEKQCAEFDAAADPGNAIARRAPSHILLVGGEIPVELGRTRALSPVVSLVSARP